MSITFPRSSFDNIELVELCKSLSCGALQPDALSSNATHPFSPTSFAPCKDSAYICANINEGIALFEKMYRRIISATR